MEVAIYIAKTIAGAVLSGSAKDAYGAVRDSLKERFNMGTSVAMIEDNPEGETEQKLLAEKLVESSAAHDEEFHKKVAILVKALSDVTDVRPEAQVLIEKVKAEEATFRNFEATGNSSIVIRDFEGQKLTVENLKAKS